jgi:transposase
MIALAAGLRVYIACGVTDMRRGMTGLAMLVQQGQFVWPSATTTGKIALSSAQLAALLDGCEWRAPARPRRPELAG